MCWRRQSRVDREGDDVALVDHQPHPAVGRDLVADPGHEVLGEPVGLEVVAVRLGRPRRVEAGPLDGVDGRQVVDPHRLDAQPHRGSRDHATSPPSACTPRGKRHVLGHEPGEVVDVTGGQPRRAERDERRHRAPARAVSPRSSASVGRPPGEVDGDERLAGGQIGVLAGPAASRAGTPRRTQQPIRRPGRQQQDGRRAAGAPGEQRLGGRDPDDRHAQPMGQALGRGDPDAQPGERARTGPDDDRRQPRSARVLLAEERADRPAAASRRAGSRPASRSPRSARRPACRRRRRPASWRCRWPG